jgi:hypothetical protein
MYFFFARFFKYRLTILTAFVHYVLFSLPFPSLSADILLLVHTIAAAAAHLSFVLLWYQIES